MVVRRALAGAASAAVVAVGCSPSSQDHAADACGSMQEHLEAMRDDGGHTVGVELAQAAAVEAERSDDDELAEALEEYQTVIARFAEANAERRDARDRLDAASDADERGDVRLELDEIEDRLDELIGTGDGLLGQIASRCAGHGVPLG